MKAAVVDCSYGGVTKKEYTVVREAYEAAGIQFAMYDLHTEEEIIHDCGGVDILLCTGNPPMSRRVMEQLPQLKFIQRFGAGVDSIDLAAATELGILVLYLPGFCTNELADLAAAMILGLIRNTAFYDREIRKGNWPKCQYLMPRDIRTMTLGLFGFGKAGRQLHDIFHRGFGTKVIAHDPYVSEEIKSRYPDVRFISFEGLLADSDILSIHVSLTAETRHVFNLEAFRRMKPTAMIINTSRGAVIDQKALAFALEQGEIQCAGLDTLEQEPIALGDPLLQMDNVILSPHSGSYGDGAKKRQIQAVCDLVPGILGSRGLFPASCVANQDVIGRSARYTFQ